jgi:hypothetical protein
VAFSPEAKHKLTPLQREWETRLSAEGLPAEPRPLTASSKRDGLKVVPLASKFSTEDQDAHADDWAMELNLTAHGGVPTTLGDTPTARYWALFGQAIHELPPTYPRRQRAFLERYSETGNVDESRRAFPKLAHTTCYAWLRKFATWRTANEC